MAYSLEMTSFLSGATINQLRSWSRKGYLVPEVQQSRPMLYSFRDLVAVRSVAKLRAFTSLQRIAKAIKTLEEQELSDHLSKVRFGFDGKSIKIWTEDQLIDVDRNPGQFEIYSFQDIYEPFENFNGRAVPNLFSPAPGITVDPHIMGGVPTVKGTRVPYDLLAGFSTDIENEEDLQDFYPFLTMDDLRNAESFEKELEAFA